MSAVPEPALPGRRAACAALDELLAVARGGRSAILVLRGAAGAGKTALLDRAEARAAGWCVLRAAGVASELELAYSGVHQLCAPLADRLGQLPEPQQDALRVAFGLAGGPPPDPFLVALAVLTLLRDAAADQPVAGLVDDAEALDGPSRQVLAFVARRLHADRVALVLAAGEELDDAQLDALPQLRIGPLDDDEACAVLLAATHGRLDEQVLDRIVAEARGNPQALLELPRNLTPAELAGGFGVAPTTPLPRRVEERFVQRLRRLPAGAQRLVLLAAAEPVGDPTLLWRAAPGLAIEPGAATAAEAEGLVEFGERVRFPRPLARCAIYRAAPLRDRQAAHLALAEAIAPGVDPDRRAWHLAQATVEADEDLARELERLAPRAHRRGGVAATAAFLDRATQLTPDPQRRAARALAAAQAMLEAATPERAGQLLDVAALGPLGEALQARLALVRAQIGFERTRDGDAVRLLADAAGRLAALDPPRAREAYLEAFGAAMFAGRLSSTALAEVAEAARQAPAAPQPPRARDLLLDGLVARTIDGYDAAVRPMRQALDAFRRHPGPDRWLSLACRVAPDVWDDEAWYELAERSVALARANDTIALLPVAATYLAACLVHAGRFDEAAALIDEADTLARTAGTRPFVYVSIVLAAWRGDAHATARLVDGVVAGAPEHGEGRTIGLGEYASAVLHNGRGEYHDALGAAQRGAAYDDVVLQGWSLAELVEAAARAERPDLAAEALQRLAARTGPAGTDWARGVEAGARALLAEGAQAEAHHRAAIAHLGRTRVVLALGRAHLRYGEWLRRERRRAEAREHLRRAHEILAGAGAEAFAERAARELRATGENVRRRVSETLDDLTPQEEQIARLARAGDTNAEIAAQLFISPRTVEWHLRQVFLKLGIRSRRDLRSALADDISPTPRG
jgi:DNA-binding CsgD family transcriptional regulator